MMRQRSSGANLNYQGLKDIGTHVAAQNALIGSKVGSCTTQAPIKNQVRDIYISLF